MNYACRIRILVREVEPKSLVNTFSTLVSSFIGQGGVKKLTEKFSQEGQANLILLVWGKFL